MTNEKEKRSCLLWSRILVVFNCKVQTQHLLIHLFLPNIWTLGPHHCFPVANYPSCWLQQWIHVLQVYSQLISNICTDALSAEKVLWRGSYLQSTCFVWVILSLRAVFFFRWPHWVTQKNPVQRVQRSFWGKKSQCRHILIMIYGHIWQRWLFFHDFFVLLFCLTSSQIWLIPLVDDHKFNYLMKLKNETLIKSGIWWKPQVIGWCSMPSCHLSPTSIGICHVIWDASCATEVLSGWTFRSFLKFCCSWSFCVCGGCIWAGAVLLLHQAYGKASISYFIGMCSPVTCQHGNDGERCPFAVKCAWKKNAYTWEWSISWLDHDLSCWTWCRDSGYTWWGGCNIKDDIVWCNKADLWCNSSPRRARYDEASLLCYTSIL